MKGFIAGLLVCGALFALQPAEAQTSSLAGLTREAKALVQELRGIRRELAGIRKQCNDPIGGI